MMAKIEALKRLIEACLAKARAPVVSYSFGKDSLAMFHPTRVMGHDLPVMFCHAPFFRSFWAKYPERASRR
jgi:3'-phosphoadenosine 5'-phosphosulfate sulfotransferase (PAPS reductase)/FAD synthetase